MPRTIKESAIAGLARCNKPAAFWHYPNGFRACEEHAKAHPEAYWQTYPLGSETEPCDEPIDGMGAASFFERIRRSGNKGVSRCVNLANGENGTRSISPK